MKTRHHRKPRSLGGLNCKENISHVPQDQHRAWHNIFYNMSAHQIAVQLGKIFQDHIFIAVPVVPMDTIRIPHSYVVQKDKSIIDESLKILFYGMTVKQMCESIQSRWIDNDFKIISLKKTIRCN